MSVTAKFDVATLIKPNRISDEVLIGKDLLELLAGAMYSDPLTIFREYVQNAADSIDAARSLGLEASDAFGVNVSLDRQQRTILIRDNGASIPETEFVSRLTALGASTKRGKGMRGFRGVGRLAGLGYCQELIFRGRDQASARVTELRWDGRKLRDLLRDSAFEGDLSAIVSDVVELRYLPGAQFPERFFEVELRKVSRLRGDLLLNDELIRSYLAQVAPVPFKPGCAAGEGISAFLRSRTIAEPIRITLDGDAEALHRPLMDEVVFSERVRDPIHSIEYVELLGQDGEVDAYGWLADLQYLGAVPRSLGFGGIRLRCGNIQIGTEQILSALFVEPRFAGWVAGELHVVSPRILPNARRDEFEASVQYAHLQDEISLLTKRLTQSIRERSISRNRVRRVQERLGHVDQWLAEAKGRDLPAMIKAKIKEVVAADLADAKKHLTKLPADHPSEPTLAARVKAAEALEKRLLKVESKLGRPSAQDKAIDVALSAILEHAATPAVGLSMSRKVLEAFDEA